MFKRKSREVDSAPGERTGFFQRLRSGISRTSAGLVDGLARLVGAGKTLDAASLEDLEGLLLAADVGVEAAAAIVDELTVRLKRKELSDPQALYAALRLAMLDILRPVSKPLRIDGTSPRPFVILMVGVNGSGKTTTIGKLAHRCRAEGHSVMLAAGDTFRAAAVEQLMAWGERNQVPVIAQSQGADPASVIYDSLAAARARGVDLLIADTAGRLHTQSNLMDELKKIKRVLGKLDPGAPHETLLVIDATAGQNALVQGLRFHAEVGLTGVVVTKLDGTAKGGIVFALAKRLGVPLRYIGIGEQMDDLREFDAEEFVDALLDRGGNAGGGSGA